MKPNRREFLKLMPCAVALPLGLIHPEAEAAPGPSGPVSHLTKERLDDKAWIKGPQESPAYKWNAPAFFHNLHSGGCISNDSALKWAKEDTGKVKNNFGLIVCPSYPYSRMILNKIDLSSDRYQTRFSNKSVLDVRTDSHIWVTNPADSDKWGSLNLGWFCILSIDEIDDYKVKIEKLKTRLRRQQ